MILCSLNGVTTDEKMDVFEGCDQNQWHGGLEYTVVLNVCVLDEMTAKGWYRGLSSTWSAGDTEGVKGCGHCQPISKIQSASSDPAVPALRAHSGPGFWGIGVCGGGSCVMPSKCLTLSGPPSDVAEARKLWVTLGKLS